MIIMQFYAWCMIICPSKCLTHLLILFKLLLKQLSIKNSKRFKLLTMIKNLSIIDYGIWTCCNPFKNHFFHLSNLCVKFSFRKFFTFDPVYPLLSTYENIVWLKYMIRKFLTIFKVLRTKMPTYKIIMLFLKSSF